MIIKDRDNTKKSIIQRPLRSGYIRLFLAIFLGHFYRFLGPLIIPRWIEMAKNVWNTSKMQALQSHIPLKLNGKFEVSINRFFVDTAKSREGWTTKKAKKNG